METGGRTQQLPPDIYGLNRTMQYGNAVSYPYQQPNEHSLNRTMQYGNSFHAEAEKDKKV